MRVQSEKCTFLGLAMVLESSLSSEGWFQVLLGSDTEMSRSPGLTDGELWTGGY